MSDAVLHLNVEVCVVSVDGHHHGERVTDFDQPVNRWRQRSFTQLNVQAGRQRVTAETDHLSVQHVDVERVGHRLLQAALPEAADGP